MVALVDPLLNRLRWGDIQRHRQLAKRTSTPHGEAAVREYAQHRPIAGHHLSVEAVDPTARRDRRELLKHPHSDATPLILTRHRKGDLGDTRVAQTDIAGDSHHAAIVPADEARRSTPLASASARARVSVRPMPWKRR
jgi:hypothetical protein